MTSNYKHQSCLLIDSYLGNTQNNLIHIIPQDIIQLCFNYFYVAFPGYFEWIVAAATINNLKPKQTQR